MCSGWARRLVVFNEQFLGRDRQALRRALAQLGCRDILYDWKKGDRSGLAYPSEFIEDFLGGSPAAVVLVRESDKNALTAIDNWMPVRHNNRPHEGYVLEFINKVVADPANFRSVMILVQMDSVLDLVDKKRQFICMLLEMLRLHSEYIGVEDLRAAAGMTSTTATNVTLWPSEDSPASFSSVTIDLSRIAKAATAELNRRGL